MIKTKNRYIATYCSYARMLLDSYSYSSTYYYYLNACNFHTHIVVGVVVFLSICLFLNHLLLLCYIMLHLKAKENLLHQFTFSIAQFKCNCLWQPQRHELHERNLNNLNGQPRKSI